MSAAPDTKVREMVIEDYDAVIKVWTRAGLTYRGNGRDSRERMSRELKSGTAIFLVAECHEGIIGTALCTNDGRKGWINRLAVVPEHQGRGVGTMLVKEAERRFESMGLEVFSCLIMKDNAESQRFFAELGYGLQDDVQYHSKRKSGDA